jgi:hypothetical protein
LLIEKHVNNTGKIQTPIIMCLPPKGKETGQSGGGKGKQNKK